MIKRARSHTRWWILAAMGAILGVILLDETVISVALPTIRQDLGLTQLQSHWIVNIYLLVLACLAGGAGRLGDILGARWLLIAGLLIFGLASALGGFAQNGLSLLISRAIQGLGAALIFPLSLLILIRSFDEGERGFALGLYGAIGTVFLSMGPLVGGLLTEYLSWRWIFWINPPVVVIVAIIAWTYWRDPPHLPELGFDWAGFFLLVVGLAALVFGIMEGPERGWSQLEVLIALSLGLLLLILFIPVERRAFTPLIAVSLFANPSFGAANMIVFTAQFVKIVLFVFGALYFQSEQGFSPLAAGAALLPVAFPQIFIAPLAGKAADKFGTRIPSLTGVACGTFGIALVAFGMQTGHSLAIMLAFLIWGSCAPFLFVPPRREVVASAPADLQGQASGISMTFQLLGGTFGMALASTAYAITQSFPVVFGLVAAFTACIFVYAFVALERSGPIAANTNTD